MEKTWQRTTPLRLPLTQWYTEHVWMDSLMRWKPGSQSGSEGCSPAEVDSFRFQSELTPERIGRYNVKLSRMPTIRDQFSSCPTSVLWRHHSSFCQFQPPELSDKHISLLCLLPCLQCFATAARTDWDASLAPCSSCAAYEAFTIFAQLVRISIIYVHISTIPSTFPYSIYLFFPFAILISKLCYRVSLYRHNMFFCDKSN